MSKDNYLKGFQGQDQKDVSVLRYVWVATLM